MYNSQVHIVQLKLSQTILNRWGHIVKTLEDFRGYENYLARYSGFFDSNTDFFCPLKDGNSISLIGFGTGTAWYKKTPEEPLNRDLVDI
ncbi:hypothetical protein BCON_0352g00010 [Botryotinia convoluta]|uniref:Uncharacterized protein n=1 Tax=Botryotinia convoluta TaxID=54673 RepID=A0A4Z1HA94_9HELO|nr:hypothetical protein BCON_0352g00010 [Botryotinia convoluta]